MITFRKGGTKRYNRMTNKSKTDSTSIDKWYSSRFTSHIKKKSQKIPKYVVFMSTQKNKNDVTFGFHALNNSLGMPLIDSEDVKNMIDLQKSSSEDSLKKEQMIKNVGLKEEEINLEALVSSYQNKFAENIKKHCIDFLIKKN